MDDLDPQKLEWQIQENLRWLVKEDKIIGTYTPCGLLSGQLVLRAAEALDDLTQPPSEPELFPKPLGAVWDVRQRRSWWEMLPEIKAERESWEEEHLPALRRRTEEQMREREQKEKELSEMRRALAWCRENGSPHLNKEDTCTKETAIG